MAASPAGDKPDPFDSPLYLLSVLYSARKSGDAILERITSRRLAGLGVRVRFADQLPRPAGRKAVTRG